MHEYDIALKRVLQPTGSGVLAELTGTVIERWHNVELPEVTNRRVDLLGSTVSGNLVHIELQSTNEADMVLRMLEYAVAIRRRFDRFPEQIVLYVGQAPLRMEDRIESAHLTYRCRFVDIRELDGERLMASSQLTDNVVAILTKLDDEQDAVRRILNKIAEAPAERRYVAFKELLILAGLRSMESIIKGESETMPILNDIMDHDVLGPQIRRGMAAGERSIVLQQIAKRFGPIPDWAKQRIELASTDEIEAIALRILDSATLEDVLQ